MLMGFGWKGMLPVALVNLLLIAVSLAFQAQFSFVVDWADYRVGGGRRSRFDFVRSYLRQL